MAALIRRDAINARLKGWRDSNKVVGAAYACSKGKGGHPSY